MVRSVLLASLAAMMLAGCAREMTRSQRAVQEQVLQDRLEDWSRVLNNRDADSLAAFYHQDPGLTVVWPDGRRTRGYEEEAAAQEEFFRGIATLNFVVQDVVVQVLNHGAGVVTFRYSADVIDTNTARDIFSGFGTMFWTQVAETGEWVIHTEHLSRTR